MNTWLEKLYETMKDVEATPIWIQIIVICVLILGGGFFLFRGKKFTVRELSIGAISVAIAFVLSYIKVSLPQGGSVTPASMLPILAYAWAFGPVAGITAGFVYGCLQLMQGMWILHPVQVVLDYLLPVCISGVCGIQQKKSADRHRYSMCGPLFEPLCFRAYLLEDVCARRAACRHILAFIQRLVHADRNHYLPCTVVRAAATKAYRANEAKPGKERLSFIKACQGVDFIDTLRPLFKRSFFRCKIIIYFIHRL